MALRNRKNVNYLSINNLQLHYNIKNIYIHILETQSDLFYIYLILMPYVACAHARTHAYTYKKERKGLL